MDNLPEVISVGNNLLSLWVINNEGRTDIGDEFEKGQEKDFSGTCKRETDFKTKKYEIDQYRFSQVKKALQSEENVENTENLLFGRTVVSR